MGSIEDRAIDILERLTSDRGTTDESRVRAATVTNSAGSFCCYCGALAPVYSRVSHRRDCPILAGRALVEEAMNRAEAGHG